MKKLLLAAIAVVVASIVVLMGPESDLRTYLLIFLVRFGMVDAASGILRFLTNLLRG
jgi:hypothetical protein